MRILLLIAIGLLLYVILSKLFRQMRQSSNRSNIESDVMVQCHHCQLHILEQEAIRKGDNYYCSAEHRDAEG